MYTLTKLQMLVPGCSCCVWQTTDITQYHGETTPIALDGCLVDWKSSTPCPTQAQLDAIPDATALAQLTADETAAANISAWNDLSIRAAYSAALLSNASLTFDQFMTDLNNMTPPTGA